MEIIVAPMRARAKATLRVERAYDFDEKRGVWMRRAEEEVEAYNLLTNTGRVQLHTFMYGTSSRTNGFNYIALSNDGTAPAAGDTSLTAELSGNGLSRVQGTVTLPTGSGNVTGIAHTFTFVGSSQAVQKVALFDSASGGVMNHEILYTQRTLLTNDQLAVTVSITAG